MTTLGWLGSILVVASLAQTEIRRMRQLNLLASGVLLVFNAAHGIVSMAVLNAVLVGFNVRHLTSRRRSGVAQADRRAVEHPRVATATVEHTLTRRPL